MRVEKYRILVADDQQGVRRLMQEIFKDPAYLVDVAANGQEALERARTARPDVVILDVKMPGMDGLETFLALRDQYPDLPVVMMTAVDNGDRVKQAMDRGAVCSITKPFDVYYVRDLIESLVRGR